MIRLLLPGALLAVVIAFAWFSHEREQQEETVPPQPQTASVTVVSPGEEGAGPAPADGAYGMKAEELSKRRQRQTHARFAEERFERAVTLDGLEPGDVAPEVRRLFETVRLAPVIDPEATRPGLVKGLRIVHLAPRNPLADRGFREGDRLIRINGEALNDPAQIAHLIARLRSNMEVCARRGERDYCRTLALPASTRQ